MTKRLSIVGNSAALIIDKPILELLGIGMDTDLNIHTDGHNLIISPINQEQNARAQVAHRRVLSRHDLTFRKLSKHK